MQKKSWLWKKIHFWSPMPAFGLFPNFPWARFDQIIYFMPAIEIGTMQRNAASFRSPVSSWCGRQGFRCHWCKCQYIWNFTQGQLNALQMKTLAIYIDTKVITWRQFEFLRSTFYQRTKLKAVVIEVCSVKCKRKISWRFGGRRLNFGVLCVG